MGALETGQTPVRLITEDPVCKKPEYLTNGHFVDFTHVQVQ